MTIEEAKFHPPADLDPIPLEPGELPASYGKNRLVLLPVDPYLIYTYWELASAAPPTTGARAVLRFHESPISTGAGVSRPFDVEVELAAGNWYVHLWSPERIYHADLGIRSEDGTFLSLAQSNTVRTPPAGPMPQDTALEPAPPQDLQPSSELPAESIRQPISVPVPQPIAISKGTAPPPTVNLSEIFAHGITDFGLPVDLGLSINVELEEGPVGLIAADPLQEDPLSEAPPPFHLADLAEIDLTQYSEERFMPGISSHGGPLDE